MAEPDPAPPAREHPGCEAAEERVAGLHSPRRRVYRGGAGSATGRAGRGEEGGSALWRVGDTACFPGGSAWCGVEVQADNPQPGVVGEAGDPNPVILPWD